MSRGTALRVGGHQAIRAPRGTGGPLPHCPDGSVILGRVSGLGHAKCVCGEVSPEALPGEHARELWIRRHKEEIAEVPWSDAAVRKDYS